MIFKKCKYYTHTLVQRSALAVHSILGSRKLDAMPCKIGNDLALHHGPSSEANEEVKIKTITQRMSKM